MSGHIISKTNNLVDIGYKLSLNEQRLILSAIIQLDGQKPIPKDNNFIITAMEFSQDFGIPIKQAYEALDDAAARLYKRDIKTYYGEEKTRGQFRWVDSVKYCNEEGKITLNFSRWAIPYLILLHQQFTSYELKQVSQLNTAYAIRFYELLLRFIQTGERYITLNRLREILELKDQYSRFYDLKKHVINPAMIEINVTTNLKIEWGIMKNGRAITGIFFVFQENNIGVN